MCHEDLVIIACSHPHQKKRKEKRYFFLWAAGQQQVSVRRRGEVKHWLKNIPCSLSTPPRHPVLSSNTFLNIAVLVWFPGWHIFVSSWVPSISSWDRVEPRWQDWWNILNEGNGWGNPPRTSVEVGLVSTFIERHWANLFQERKGNLYSREIIWHFLLFVLPKWWTD